MVFKIHYYFRRHKNFIINYIKMQSSERKVFVIGVGMTKFMRPGKHQLDYPDFANLAMRRALRDSNVSYKKV